jgi:hypothetical protein
MKFLTSPTKSRRLTDREGINSNGDERDISKIQTSCTMKNEEKAISFLN